MTKINAKNQAMVLRKQGHSYNHILKYIPVSKSTLSYWLSDISYIPNKETVARIGKARAISGMAKSREKIKSIIAARQQAQKDIKYLSKRDLFMLGIGLYMGEGTKTHNITRIINADPRIIKFAIRWLKESCGLNTENLSLRIHLYPDNDIKKCLQFWSGTTNIPISQFQKTQIDRRRNKKMYKRGKLPYGTAHLTVKSNGIKEFGVFLFRRINGWLEEVLK